jgi:hypothetical protein
MHCLGTTRVDVNPGDGSRFTHASLPALLALLARPGGYLSLCDSDYFVPRLLHASVPIVTYNGRNHLCPVAAASAKCGRGTHNEW